MASPKPRILIADDHTLLREGLAGLLTQDGEFEVVGGVSDGQAAVDFVERTPVDVVIMDIAMPRLTGLAAARLISKDNPGVVILMLTMHDNEQFLFEALKVGAAGYVHKSTAHRDLVSALRGALNGEPFLYPGAVATLIREFVARPTEAASLLSAREEQVLKLIAEGNTGREIATLLHISPKTVDRHRANILDKLSLKDRVDLTRYAIRAGLIEA